MFVEKDERNKKTVTSLTAFCNKHNFLFDFPFIPLKVSTLYDLPFDMVFYG